MLVCQPELTEYEVVLRKADPIRILQNKFITGSEFTFGNLLRDVDELFERASTSRRSFKLNSPVSVDVKRVAAKFWDSQYDVDIDGRPMVTR
jgi:hypothetical protein